jgi:hypothetical protein
LGLWFRYNTWLIERGSGGAVMVLIGMFVAYRVGVQLLHDADLSGGAQLLQYVWLGLCVYTWVGPKMFRDAVAKELQKVQLREDF